MDLIDIRARYWLDPIVVLEKHQRGKVLIVPRLILGLNT